MFPFDSSDLFSHAIFPKVRQRALPQPDNSKSASLAVGVAALVPEKLRHQICVVVAVGGWIKAQQFLVNFGGNLNDFWKRWHDLCKFDRDPAGPGPFEDSGITRDLRLEHSPA